MASLLTAAAALRETIAARAAAQETARSVDPKTLSALEEAGIFRAFLPAAYGGAELAPPESLALIEEISRGDGSTGWLVMVAATSALCLAYLPDGGGRAVASELGARMMAGVFAPTGLAEETPEGLLVSGRWSFLSGGDHAPFRVLGVMLSEAGKPKLEGGVPVVRHVVMARSEAERIDTWRVSGLRATGSHDAAVKAILVPHERVFSMIRTPPTLSSAVYAFPPFGFLAMGVAAVTLGIARAALDAFSRIAATKKPAYSRRTLAEHETVQTEYAVAEAELRAARSLLFGATAEAWTAALRGAGLGGSDRINLRLAASHAVRAASRVVDAAYHLGGGSAIYDTSPLQRHFRDVHVATQHVMIAPATFAVCGRALLGLETDLSMV